MAVEGSPARTQVAQNWAETSRRTRRAPCPWRDIGFVDAAVLALVERLNEPKLATLDRRHFGLLRPRHVDALHLLPE